MELIREEQGISEFVILMSMLSSSQDDMCMVQEQHKTANQKHVDRRSADVATSRNLKRSYCYPINIL